MGVDGARFLHQRNPDFHASPAVDLAVDYLRSNGDRIPNQPEDHIAAYLGFLASEVNDGILTGDEQEIKFQAEASSIEMTPENIETYARFNARLMWESGYGDLDAPARWSDEEKQIALKRIHDDQVGQLVSWARALNDPDANYPDWFKYWAFEYVRHSSQFIDNHHVSRGKPAQFERRSADTLAFYPNLGEKALSIVYSAVTERLGGPRMDDEYDSMRRLLPKAHFGELYAEAQNYEVTITEEMREVITGTWLRFEQSDRIEDAQFVARVLSGYRNDWCTIGPNLTGFILSYSDVDVFLSTHPAAHVDIVTRLAILTAVGRVYHVYGIDGGRRQIIEPGLMDVVKERLAHLPAGDRYFQRRSDMDKLTAIADETASDPDVELSPEDAAFLYEVEREIEGFGYTEDRRIEEVRSRRGKRDIPEIAQYLAESLPRHGAVAYATYDEVAAELFRGSYGYTNGEIVSSEIFRRLLEVKARRWYELGVFEFIADELVTGNKRYILIATPNIPTDRTQLVSLANFISRGQGQPLDITSEFIDSSAYSPEQYSGNQGLDPVRFSFISSDVQTWFRNDCVDFQLPKLSSKQQEHPTINLHVPSLLDNLVYWQLLSQGRYPWAAVRGRIPPILTRQIDLPTQRIGSKRYLPALQLYKGAGSEISMMSVNVVSGTQLAVG